MIISTSHSNSEGKTAPKIQRTTSIANSSNETDKQHQREADDGNSDTIIFTKEYACVPTTTLVCESTSVLICSKVVIEHAPQ